MCTEDAVEAFLSLFRIVFDGGFVEVFEGALSEAFDALRDEDIGGSSTCGAS